MNFGRNFRVREGMNLFIRAEFTNIFNRVFLSAPSLANPNLPVSTTPYNGRNINNTGFGSIATLNGGRHSPRWHDRGTVHVLTAAVFLPETPAAFGRRRCLFHERIHCVSLDRLLLQIAVILASVPLVARSPPAHGSTARHRRDHCWLASRPFIPWVARALVVRATLPRRAACPR